MAERAPAKPVSELLRHYEVGSPSGIYARSEQEQAASGPDGPRFTSNRGNRVEERYYEAEIQLRRVVGELDRPALPLRDRVEAALNHALMLNRFGITVPEEIRTEVERLHKRISIWVLPGTTNAIGTAVGWMDDQEIQAQEAEFRSWYAIVSAVDSREAED